jgi:hypothetical protein
MIISGGLVQPLDRDKRLTMRALHHWRDILGSRAFPRSADVDAAALGDDWRNCLLIGLTTPLERSQFRHVGCNLCPAPGIDFAGRPLAECREHTVLREATSYISRVLERRVPIGVGGSIAQGDRAFLYRSILMPLSDDAGAVDAIFGAASFREVHCSDEEFPS